MSTFYKMSGNVGKGAPNNAGDVAFVQLAMKVSKGRNGKPYYSGSINGRYSDKLMAAVSQYGFETNFSLPIGKIRPDQSDLLTGLMPFKYFDYELLALSNGGLILVPPRNRSSFSAVKLPYTIKNLRMPDDAAKGLIKILKTISNSFGVGVSIANLTPLSGKISARISIVGGKKINRQTGGIQDRGQALRPLDIADFLKSKKGGPLDPGFREWEIKTYSDASTKNTLVLVSKKVNALLVASPQVQKDVLRTLGYVSTSSYDEGVRATCYAAYELSRLRDTPSDTEVKTLKACFGNEWNDVQRQERARKKAASELRKRLDEQIQERDRLQIAVEKTKERLIETVKELNALPDAELELFRDVVNLIHSPAKTLKSGLKATGFMKETTRIRPKTSSDIVKEKAGETGFDSAYGLIYNGPEPSDDVVDYLIHGASAVIFLITVVGLFVPGVNVAILGAAVLLGRIVLMASMVKSGFDYIQAKAEEYDLENEVASITNHLKILINKYVVTLDNVAQMLAVASSDGSKSFADYGYSSAEIQQAVLENKNLAASS